jgi:hypothetical protein
MTIPKSSKWRQSFKVHPAAEKLPRMSDAELRALSKDISENGLSTPIDFRMVGEDREILDGRHRMDALEMAGIEPPAKAFRELDLDEAGAVLHVISMNIHRRHLDHEQKRQVIADLLKADPSLSDRQIGKAAAADHKTVAAQRGRMERTGELPQLKKRKGADGKIRKAKPAEVTDTRRETYAAPRSHKLALETHVGVDAARRYYLGQCEQLEVDIDAELDIIVDALREIAGRTCTSSSSSSSPPNPSPT